MELVDTFACSFTGNVLGASGGNFSVGQFTNSEQFNLGRLPTPAQVLHAFNDFLQFIGTGGIEAQQVALYIPLLKIVISGLLALYGVYLLRGDWQGEAFGHV